jgi:hypothetical protein
MTTISPLAPETTAHLNQTLTTAPDPQLILDELHIRALLEDAARDRSDDEWTIGMLAAQAEWNRVWPTDPTR